MGIPFSPAADRNKQPILDVLRGVLPPSGEALEIASGSGQHAAWFATGLPGWRWQPTDLDPRLLPSIDRRMAEAGLDRVHKARHLDVLSADWPSSGPAFERPFDVVYCANMLHIAPWACCPALMRGSAQCMAATGLLVVYGPFLEQGLPTAPGNVAFDQSLRAQDALWGIRDLADVSAEAEVVGLQLQRRVAMPANNLLLVFGRRND